MVKIDPLEIATHPDLAQLLDCSAGDATFARYTAATDRAGRVSYGLDEPEICLLDVETTGLDPGADEIIEIAIARMRGPEIVAEYSTFVRPRRTVPPLIYDLTGIESRDLETAPDIVEVIEAVRAFIGDADIIAHNAGFDRAFVQAAVGLLPGAWLDSLVLLRLGLPGLRSYKQENLMRVFCPETARRAHRAYFDVRGLCTLWRVALACCADLEPGMQLSLAGLVGGPEAAWLSRLAECRTEGRVGNLARPNLRTLREVCLQNHEKGSERVQNLRDALGETLDIPDSQQLARDLSGDGLAGALYPDFEPRPEQLEMAAAIARAQEEQRHVVIEAGTGVGKSLAYLVCLARLALGNGISVGVATKTNTLTDQLMYRELPALSAALEAEGAGRLRYVALKGYDHYLCLRKLDTALRDVLPALAGGAETEVRERAAGTGGNLNLALAQLLSWVAQTAWGEMRPLNLGLPSGDRALLTCNARDCNKRRCRYWRVCYLQGIRRRAKTSHLVVTNHALLFRNASLEGSILPPIRYWLVDEAHNAEAEARKQLAQSLEAQEVSALLRQLGGGRGSIANRAKRYARTQYQEGDETLGAITAAAAACEQEQALAETLAGNFWHATGKAAEAVAQLLKPSERARQKADTRFARSLWINDELRDTPAWATLTENGRTLYGALQTTASAARTLLRAVSIEDAEQLGDTSTGDFGQSKAATELADLVGVISALEQTAEILATVIGQPDPSLVYSFVAPVSVDTKQLSRARFEVQELDVGARIVDELLASALSVTFTSATLAVGDDFSRFTRGVGLDRLPPEQGFDTLLLVSGYDLPAQMRIFVPVDLPDPRDSCWRKAFEDLLESIHHGAGGGTLTLFTNRADMRGVYENLRQPLSRLGIELLSQSTSVSPKTLADRFVADSKTSLLATKSFWEGFDARGDTLRCVVISKIPFQPPTDPLSLQREQVDSRAWGHFALPDAILELKQAVGRLIRSTTDRGCVIIADSRIATKAYGARVRASLPVEVEQLSTSAIIEEVHQFY
ncbi:MAG: hypothetical protein LBJ07_04495, partial [Actinomycetes bacterium]|nr:hypothetical protein [Actinomycetes bacterium]